MTNRISKWAAVACAVASLSASAVAMASAAPRPESAAPGALDRTPVVASSCPVWSWGAFPDARGYELRVVALGAGATGSEPEPLWSQRIRGAALSWQAPRERCLAAGEYAWVVRAETAGGWSAWSEPRFFAVEDEPPGAELRRLVEELLEARLSRAGAGPDVAAAAPNERAARPTRPRKAGAASTSAPAACQAGTEVFADVPASSPYCGWIEQLYRDGIVDGCGSGNFCPTSGMTRQQTAALVARAMSRRSVRDLEAGTYSSCAVSADGRAACWGDVGIGEARPPRVGFRSITAGQQFGCGLQSTGALACWGENNAGQATPPAGSFIAVAAGGRHACAIQPGGAVACWGYGAWGQTTPPAASFTSLAGGTYHTCGVKAGGALACWGRNSAGESAPPIGIFTAVSAGDSHTCGIKLDGSVACWGSNASGQASPPAGAFTAVAAGGAHSCGIRADGSLACWGRGNEGQTAAPWGAFAAVAAGDAHSCGLTTEGVVLCWGSDAYGQAAVPAAL